MSKTHPFRVGMLSMAAAIGAALVLAGCGTTPLSPSDGSSAVSGAASGPEVLMVQPDGSVSYVPARVASAMSSVLPTSSDRSLTTTAKMDGAEGGVLQCGRFLLHVPAGAFDGTGTLTMRMRDSTVMLVDLDISPAELNGFKLPVTLAINATGADVSVDSLGMYWYDPEKSLWTGLSCDKDLTTDPVLLQTIQDVTGSLIGTTTDTTSGLWTPLAHFSTYSAGKAGW